MFCDSKSPIWLSSEEIKSPEITSKTMQRSIGTKWCNLVLRETFNKRFFLAITMMKPMALMEVEQVISNTFNDCRSDEVRSDVPVILVTVWTFDDPWCE